MNRYEEIENDLLEKIRNGTYNEGDTIPKETELAELYGVSRPTIRQAVQTLAGLGFVEKKKKRGTVVKSQKVEQLFTSQIQSFDEDMHLLGRSTRSVVITFRRDVASEEVAEALSIKAGGAVYKLVRLRFVDDQANVFVETYLPVEGLPNLDPYDFSKVSLYKTLESYDCSVESAKRRLEVIKADEYLARLLDVKDGDPLFLFHTIGQTRKSIPIEYSIATYRGEGNVFDIEVQRRRS